METLKIISLHILLVLISISGKSQSIEDLFHHLSIGQNIETLRGELSEKSIISQGFKSSVDTIIGDIHWTFDNHSLLNKTNNENLIWLNKIDNGVTQIVYSIEYVNENRLYRNNFKRLLKHLKRISNYHIRKDRYSTLVPEKYSFFCLIEEIPVIIQLEKFQNIHKKYTAIVFSANWMGHNEKLVEIFDTKGGQWKQTFNSDKGKMQETPLDECGERPQIRILDIKEKKEHLDNSQIVGFGEEIYCDADPVTFNYRLFQNSCKTAYTISPEKTNEIIAISEGNMEVSKYLFLEDMLILYSQDSEGKILIFERNIDDLPEED